MDGLPVIIRLIDPPLHEFLPFHSDLLRELVLFDVYSGTNIDSGLKSLAVGLILQASSQTLTDELVEGAVGRVLARLASEFGARLRD